MVSILSRAFLVLAVLSAPAWGQAENPPVYPGKIGFLVAGLQGAAGEVCSGFACQARRLGLTRGETLTATIRSNPNSRWILVAGPQAGPCVTLPGFNNGWAGPAIPVAAGILTRPDTIRCWGARGTLALPVPPNQPLQSSLALQVVADNSAGPSWSTPVQLTVTR